jgi:hypothetical protein
MTKTRSTAGIFLFACLLGSATVWAQANVDESQETAVVYVDASHGSDSNPGTRQQPFQTLAKGAETAVSNNWKSIGTKVIINPGTYREAVAIHGGARETSLPMTFEAGEPGTVMISGSDLWTGWKVYGPRQRKYWHHWPYQWGLCPADGGGAPFEPEIARRREMLFVNGTQMTQVLSPTALQVGTFYVDESGGTVSLFPPLGTDMNTAQVEVAVREVLWDVRQKSNVVLRGLSFTHASSCRGDSALYIHGSSNILVDKSAFYWNNASGVLLMKVSYTSVQNSVADHNGASGMKGRESKYDLWHNLRTWYNGWRGAQGVYYKWGVAGSHFALSHEGTASKINSSWNQTQGFHWDTDNVNVSADALTGSHNLLAGMVVERTQGPLQVSNSVFCNGNPLTGPNTVGFKLRNSAQVSLSGSLLRNNKMELAITGDAGGWPIQNWETGQNLTVINQDFTATNNVLEAGTGQQTLNDGILGGADWSLFVNTLASDYNTWWNREDKKPFTVPTPDPWTKLDFPGWQAASQADRHSVWKAPGPPGSRCDLAADATDFWFVMDYQSGVQTVTPGGTATFTGYVVPLAFSGTVKLTSDGAQEIPGVTVNWSPRKIDTSGLAVFTFATSHATPKGTYPLTLVATSGSVTRTMSVFVTVNQAE